MIATPDIERIIGADAVDPNNDRIGKVSQVYVDADTDQPTWASVKTGLFGLSESVVPLQDATWDSEALHVSVDKARVKDAPRVEPEAEISPDEQDRLYQYYGLGGGAAVGGGSGLGGTGTVGAGTLSDTGYGAGAGAAAGTGAAAAAHHGGGPAGPRFDRGQSHEADEDRVETENAGYGLVSDEPGGPGVE